MTVSAWSQIWNADKPADESANKPASKPARKAKGEAGRSEKAPNSEALNEKKLESAPGGQSSGRALLWGKRLAAAAVVAMATGIGTGLAGKAYEEGKAWFFAVFASHGWTAYVIEPNPLCDTFTLSESEKAFKDAGLYEYIWKVIRVSKSWSGSSHKRANTEHSYFLNGIDQGTYTIITYSSAQNYDGIGSYTLSHRPGTSNGKDYYVGYWIGRECSIQGHPLG